MPRFALFAAAVGLVSAGCGVAPVSFGAASRAPVEFSPYHHNQHNAVVRVVTARRLVALTFDDGPDPRYTPAVLRSLRRAGAHATFFVIGRAALRHPGVVGAEVRAGHEVGDHTFDHRRLPPLSARRIAWELTASARAIERAGAPVPRFSRPPWGFFDERVGAIAAAQGRPLIGWDLALEKAIDRRGTRAGVRAIAASVRPGSIVLAHDGRIGRERTVVALPMLLTALRARGFRVVSVGELLRARSTRA